MIRIALIIPTLTAGGAERVMSELANSWCATDSAEVNMILLAEGEVFYPLHPAVKIHRLGLKIGLSRLERILSLLLLGYKLRQAIRQIAPDTILSFMNKYNIFVLLSLLGAGRKVVVSERDGPSEKIPLATALLRDITYRWAAGVICQTHASRNFIARRTGHLNIAVIPNPVTAQVNTWNGGREKIILNTARLVPKKGQKYLLDAFSKVSQKHPEWRLVILGDGPLRAELSMQVDRLRLGQNVTLAGTVQDIQAWVQRSSIFAFSSLLEGFPNALAEAMAGGLPAVSFNCDAGPADIIIDEKNGYLVEVGNVELFTSRLLTLIENPDLRDRFSDEAKKVGKRLNANAISAKYLNFCKSAA